MQHETDDKRDFEEFMCFAEERLETPPPPPLPLLRRELVGSSLKLAFVYTIGCFISYSVSLALCAQCSIGLTPIAWKTAHLMRHLDETACALLCGAIFGLGPVVTSALFLTRFQHRYLLFRMGWLVGGIPVMASVLMTIISSVHDVTWHMLWIASAVGTPYLFEGASAFLLKQREYVVRSLNQH